MSLKRRSRNRALCIVSLVWPLFLCDGVSAVYDDLHRGAKAPRYDRSVVRLLSNATAATEQSGVSSDRPLPNPGVLTADGTTTPVHTLASEGQWLILYVVANSPASARLLEAMTSWELAQGASRVVVIVGGAPDARLGESWAQRLPGVRWVADPSNEFAQAAGIRGAPTVLGARDAQLAWILAGVLNDPKMLRDVITSWVAPAQ